MVSGQSTEHIPSVVGLPNAAQALINALKLQGQPDWWCSLEPRSLLPSSSQLEQAFTDSGKEGVNLMEEIKRSPDRVSWIGDPSRSPLAVIHGPTGTFAVTKTVIVIGRDNTDSSYDLTSQEANFSSSCMVLSYTGHPNRWGVEINGNNGVIINNKLYHRTTVPQYLPFSCVFRFPPSSENFFFQAVELPRCERVSRIILSPDGLFKKNAKIQDGYQKAERSSVDTVGTASPSSSEETSTPTVNQRSELLSVEENKQEQQVAESLKEASKPLYSYAQLIAQAILSTPDKQITLAGIYQYIMQKYPWYQTCDKGWQNSIRHNLSLSRYFVRTARAQNEPGKGSFWKMEPVTAQRTIAAAFEKKKARNLKGFKSMNASVSDLEDFFSEGPFTPPPEALKTSDEDVETGTRQDGSYLARNEESRFLHHMISEDSNPTYMLQHQAATLTVQNQIIVPEAVNAVMKATNDDVIKDLPKLTEVPHTEQFHDLEGGRLTDLERCCEWSTRTAQSAPCSPKGILSRREQPNGGSTFRVRQSVKDGRSLLQICHSPPEFRSTANNRYAEAVSTNSRNQILYQLRGGTKSLSTTPVRELLQGTSGLRFEDLKRDFPNLPNQSVPKDRGLEPTLGKADETVATTSFFPRSHSDPSAPFFTMAQEQRSSPCGKSKMSIYGKHSEHVKKMKGLEIYEEVKDTSMGSLENTSLRATRKYGMDGTMRPDIDKLLLASSKRYQDPIITSAEERVLSPKMPLKRKHGEDSVEESVKRCHSSEIAQKICPPLEKGLVAALARNSAEIPQCDDEIQVVHVSQASTASLCAQFVRDGLPAHPSLPAAVTAISIAPSREYHKHISHKNDGIAKPIPLGPSGPAVKQLLSAGKSDGIYSPGKSEISLAKHYEDYLLRSTSGAGRETNVHAGIPFPHMPSSSRIEPQNPNLYRQVVSNPAQGSLHVSNPAAAVSVSLTNSFVPNMQPQLQAGIRPPVPPLQRGILSAQTISGNVLNPSIFTSKSFVPVNVQTEAMNAKTANSPSMTGKMFSPRLTDVGFPLQNLNRSQGTITGPQQQAALTIAQPQSSLNIQLPSVINGIRLPSSLPIPARTLNIPTSVSSSSFSNVNDRNVGNIANLLQSSKNQNDQLGLSREQMNMSQEILEASLKYEAIARFITEQSNQLQKLVQQQQQQQSLVAALQAVGQDQVTNPAFNNVLLSQCINMNLLQQLKSPTNNLSTVMLPGNNPLTLLAAPNSYLPVSSRPDLVANGVVNNGVCELIGMPARSVNNLLDARNVSGL